MTCLGKLFKFILPLFILISLIFSLTSFTSKTYAAPIESESSHASVASTGTSKPTSKVQIFIQNHCEHEWENGACTKCKLKCDHPAYDKKHNCTVCGSQCTHRNWENSVCKNCGEVCHHDVWSNGVCEQCKIQCDHNTYKNGICNTCGKVCSHSKWEDGECEICGIACQHKSHDPNTLKCTQCGELQYHDFKNGICVICNTKPTIYTSVLPETLFDPEIEEKGTVENLEFKSCVTGDNRPIRVYLPYGYDKFKQYNVAILLHGAGDGCESFIDGSHDVYNIDSNEQDPETGEVKEIPEEERKPDVTFKDLYDNMIYEHTIKPLIVVTVQTHGEKIELARELRENILPMIVDSYSTYALDNTEDAIRDARQHFAIGGYSNGSIYSIGSGFIYNFDLFGNYILMSGNNDVNGIIHVANDDGNDNEKNSKSKNEDEKIINNLKLPIYSFINVTGAKDTQLEATKQGYEKAVEEVERLVADSNAFYIETDHGHDFVTWTIGTYDALQLLFQDVE